MALAHCILSKFLGVSCHCFPLPLDAPPFSARCLHVQRRERPLAAEGGTIRGREMFRQISSRIRLPRNYRDLLHAANLRHERDGFTSPPKEVVLRIFSPLKIRRLRPCMNPRTWVPRASRLSLDQSQLVHIYTQKIHRTTQNKQYIEQHKGFGRVRAVPRLCELYPGICLTNEQKARKKPQSGYDRYCDEIRQEYSSLGKVGLKYQALYMKTKTRLS
jgi:hypothetical protein